MYPRNSATPPRIALGAVVQISDGAPQTTGVSVVVRASGGAETAGGGTLAKGTTTDTWYYTPTQAETNYTDFVVTAFKAGCFPVSQTIITSASDTAGIVVTDTASRNASKADVSTLATQAELDKVPKKGVQSWTLGSDEQSVTVAQT